MSYYSYLDASGYAGDLATISGLRDFKRWVASLPLEVTHDAIDELLEHGTTSRLDELHTQLWGALLNARPDDGVVDIASGIIAALETREKDDRTFFLTDGMVENDGEDEGEVAES
ncbi:MAG: hypothetical protein ACYCW6_08445 [Candidatus Xenobia bacterium]